MPNSRSEITTLLCRCSKCEQDHHDLTFKKLTKPIHGYFYWAKCPVTGDPILTSDPNCGPGMHYV